MILGRLIPAGTGFAGSQARAVTKLQSDRAASTHHLQPYDEFRFCTPRAL